MKTEFTPGPWAIIDLIVVAHADKGLGAFELCDPGYGCNDKERLLPIDEREANARLIAAAPDLFAALENLCADKSVSDGEVPCDLFDAARAALAKATGHE